MRYLGEDELTQVMGIGYPGEVAQASNGKAYQWVQGIDGLGNPIGFWKPLRRLVKRARPFLRRALPIVQKVASYIPIPQAQAAAAGLKVATPLLQRAGVAGSNGLGALYEAEDGTLFQVQGLAQDEELRGFAEDEELQGLGALYQGPDALYQVQGFAEDEELRGLAEDEELQGYGEDEELQGLTEDEELTGFGEDEEIQRGGEDEELRGVAENEEVQGFAEDEELQGLDQGYVREAGTSGLEAYLPEQPPRTRWFVSPNQPPKMWEPLW